MATLKPQTFWAAWPHPANRRPDRLGVQRTDRVHRRALPGQCGHCQRDNLRFGAQRRNKHRRDGESLG